MGPGLVGAGCGVVGPGLGLALVLFYSGASGGVRLFSVGNRAILGADLGKL
jgi:hypothetical protein